MKAEPVLDRIMRRIDVVEGSGCWLWRGHVDRDGYGRVKFEGKVRLVHRMTYTLFVGEIADGMTIDHVRARGCAHRHCCNPEHLEPVPPAENNRRGDSPSARHARKARCIRGHDLGTAHIDPSGRRVCNACVRARRQERKRQ